MFEEISVTDAIEVSPVVATGRRWATPREQERAEEYFRRFPEARDDARRRGPDGLGRLDREVGQSAQAVRCSPESGR